MHFCFTLPLYPVLVSLATSKETFADESGSGDTCSRVIHAYLKVTSHHDDPVPTISSLDRSS